MVFTALNFRIDFEKSHPNAKNISGFRTGRVAEPPNVLNLSYKYPPTPH